MDSMLACLCASPQLRGGQECVELHRLRTGSPRVARVICRSPGTHAPEGCIVGACGLDWGQRPSHHGPRALPAERCTLKRCPERASCRPWGRLSPYLPGVHLAGLAALLSLRGLPGQGRGRRQTAQIQEAGLQRPFITCRSRARPDLPGAALLPGGPRWKSSKVASYFPDVIGPGHLLGAASQSPALAPGESRQ